MRRSPRFFRVFARSYPDHAFRRETRNRKSKKQDPCSTGRLRTTRPAGRTPTAEAPMPGDPRTRVTEILAAVTEGGEAPGAASDELLPLVYQELRRLAQRYLGGRGAQTLQATEVVHDAYLRLVGSPRDDWRGKSHFFAAAARAMRHLLVDQARRKGREKRGGQRLRVTFEEVLLPHAQGPADLDQLLALDAALERLAELSERQARVVELRFFGGLKVDEVAELLGVSRRSVEGDWTIAKAWLRRELTAGAQDKPLENR